MSCTLFFRHSNHTYVYDPYYYYHLKTFKFLHSMSDSPRAQSPGERENQMETEPQRDHKADESLPSTEETLHSIASGVRAAGSKIQNKIDAIGQGGCFLYNFFAFACVVLPFTFYGCIMFYMWYVSEYVCMNEKFMSKYTIFCYIRSKIASYRS